MAASLGKNARVTLTTTRLLFIDRNQRTFSISQICCGSDWHVHGKPSRLKEIYRAPDVTEKFPGKGDVKHINIPDKIERSPTAILEALASTVKNHLNQPMYKSIDDPYLYLTSDGHKRQQMAAMDSGRKTAQMMVSMYPDYFTHIWKEPLPDCYRDANLGYKFKDPSEEALLERIGKLSVQDAVGIYDDLMAKNKHPSQEAQEKLLELLTVFNCQNPDPASDLSVYVNHVPLTKTSPFPVSTWKKGNIAEQVFNSLPTKTAKAYCYMIRGMAANFDKQGALNMFNEMKAANLVADVYTYNKLLSVASLETDYMDDVKQFVEIILRDMAANNVTPNAQTFVAILGNCKRLSRWTGSKTYALSVVSEMKACGIAPTLATYDELLKIFYYHNDKRPKTPLLFENILDEIEGKEFKCTAEGDVTFFRTAINAIKVHFPDSKCALRLHKILKTGKNSDLLGHRQLEFSYYQDLFTVITPLEHIDLVMELYSSVVPHIFTPTFEVYVAIFESIQMHDAYTYIPQLYADLQNSSYFSEREFTEIFTQMMAKEKHDAKLQGQLCDIATSLLNNWLKNRDRFYRNKPFMNGTVIGHFITTFLNNDQPKKAWELFQLYQNDSHIKYNHPSEESLTKLTEQLIVEQNYTAVKEVLDLMQNVGYTGLSPLVEKVLQAFELTDQERNYLKCLEADTQISTDSISSDSD